MESPKFRDSFQEFLESEHVKGSCARVVQDIAESHEVAQGISSGALNTGIFAALGVARQVPLVGRFVPAQTKGDHDWDNPLSPRAEKPPAAPPQNFVDIAPDRTSWTASRARWRGHSAEPRDRGFSSASTQASSETSSQVRD